MSDFLEPIGNEEAIFQNILGADNEILPPMSRNEALLMQIKDLLENSSGGKYTVTATVTLDTVGDHDTISNVSVDISDIEDIIEAQKSGKVVELVCDVGAGGRMIIPLSDFTDSADYPFVHFSATKMIGGKYYYVYVDTAIDVWHINKVELTTV